LTETHKQQQGTMQEVDQLRALVQQQGTSSKVQLEATISRLSQESSRLTTQLHQLRATTAKSTTEAQELARRLKGEVQALKAKSIAEAARESKAREQAHRQEEELAEACQAVHLVSAEKAGLDARVGSKEVLLHELRAQVTRLTAELAEARSLKPASNVHSELQVYTLDVLALAHRLSCISLLSYTTLPHLCIQSDSVLNPRPSRPNMI